MQEDNFTWLLKWYHRHCNGDWEHGYGIHIDTIDNPGWSISINLDGTKLENIFFDDIEIEVDDNNWYFCCVRDCKFEARCGPVNCIQVLQIFRNWVEQVDE